MSAPGLSSAPPADKFRAAANVILSALLGALIGAPFVLAGGGAMETASFAASVGAGALIGYRKRDSVAYFYMVLAACAVLTTVIGGQIDPGTMR